MSPTFASILLFAIGSNAVVLENDQQVAEFQIADVQFKLVVPNGYCLPAGEYSAIAQTLSAADNRNVTHAMWMACDKDGAIFGNNDYSIVKTPKEALLANLERDELLEALGDVFDKPEFGELISSKSLNEDAGRELASIIGSKIDIEGKFEPLGKDDFCAYLGGTLAVNLAGQEGYLVSGAACMTVVAGKLVTTYRYSEKTDLIGIAKLSREAKLLAESIQEVNPKTE